MKVEVQKLEEKNTILIKVEVPADRFSEVLDKTYKKIANQLVIPGFRKGRIPKPVIDSRVGKRSVQEEALQSALPQYYIEALQDSKVEPVDQPKIDIVQMEEGKPLKFTATVVVTPEVKLGEYKGVEVEKLSTEPTDEEISHQIESLRESFATLELVEDRAANDGDFVLIDFEGFVDGRPFEGGSANDYLLEIGSETFIPGFEEQLVGMKKGEAKEITVPFPDDYGSEKLAGKEAKFKISLKEIKEKKLQEVDDDFAKQVGFDTVDELQSDIKEKIREVKKKLAESSIKSAVVEKIADSSELDIPEVMIENEIDDMIDDLARDARRQGMELDQYLNLVGKTKEDLKNEWRDRARNRVRGRLVVEAVAKAENIEVTPEEVDNEVEKAAEAAGRDFEEVKQIFTMRGSLDELKKRLIISKTIDWLVEHAKIKESSNEKALGKQEEKEKIQGDKGTE